MYIGYTRITPRYYKYDAIRLITPWYNMTISGKIEDFPLTEIVQVIGYSKRTGRLEIRGNSVSLSIVFRNGYPVLITPEYNSVMLGHLLVKGEAIGPAGLNNALTVQEEKRSNGVIQSLGDVLLELDLVDRETLEKYLAIQVRDTIYDILSERNGTFEFIPIIDPPETEAASPIIIADIILNGMREIEYRARIREILALADVVLKKNSGIEVTDIGLLVGEERMVYFAVDGIKSVAEILGSANLAHLNVSETLYRLVKKSYVKIPEPYLSENRK